MTTGPPPDAGGERAPAASPGPLDALHPQARALIASDSGRLETSDLAASRAGYLGTALRLGGPLEPVGGTEDLVVPRPDGGRIRARLYVPAVEAASPPGLVVWFHGGGWCVGDIEGYDRTARCLANAMGHRLLSVDYRLAPEDPFPAAVEDARAAVAWAAGAEAAERLGVRGDRIVAGGDSAGGNLAAVAVRHHPDRVALQVLVYPATDAACGTESYRRFADFPGLTAEAMRGCYDAYAGPQEDPDVSPLRAPSLAGLPPAFVALAGVDVLRDDGAAYADALRAAGVPVEVVEYADMPHGFIRWAGVTERTRELHAEIARAVRAAFG